MAVGGEEAPPHFRLSAMSYQIASLEKNLREQVRKRERGDTLYTYIYILSIAVYAAPGCHRCFKRSILCPEREGCLMPNKRAVFGNICSRERGLLKM